MTTVIGVFDNDSDLEMALNRLYNREFNDIRVVDRSRQTDQTGVPGATLMAGIGLANNTTNAGSSAAFPAPYLVPGFFGIADDTVTGGYIGDLLDIDLGDQEADFYANAVRRGAKLLLVETDDDRAGEVRSILLNTNASQYTRSA